MNRNYWVGLPGKPFKRHTDLVGFTIFDLFSFPFSYLNRDTVLGDGPQFGERIRTVEWKDTGT
jgi:hypothetical protein